MPRQPVGLVPGLGEREFLAGPSPITFGLPLTNLVGWVTMALFGGYYALNPAKAGTRLAQIHFWSFAGAAVVLAPSIYAMYMGFTAIEPLLAISSIVAFLSVLVFAAVVFTKAEATVRSPTTAAAA